ncbi:MAG: ankyrin repeat domain-containing protein [Treponema sp.]|uniref:ankyrin repeat domain-containing protein n=1 Tax=Treponema sp. TaxID=166 RepID=UPI003FA319E8
MPKIKAGGFYMYLCGCTIKKERAVLFLLFLIPLTVISCVSEPKRVENNLVTMVKARDIEGVKARFSTEEINTKDSDGYSLLHIAVRQNDAALTEYLLSMGADREVRDPEGNTALIAAAEANAWKAAQVLAQHNAQIFARNQDEVSAFQLFYDKHQTAVILNAQTVLQQDEDGNTLLHYAAGVLDQNLTAALLTAAGDNTGALIQTPDSQGLSALGIVYTKPYEKAAAAIAAALLQAGAAPLNGEFAAFEKAAVQRNYAMLFAEGQTALHFAAAAGHTGFVQYLLEQKAPVDAKNSANMTPLHEAVRSGQTETAALLLNAGAQPDAAAALGNTALHFAVTAPHNTELVTLLLEKKANPSLKDEYGETPLHIAVRVGADTEVLTALTQAGAVVNERNKRGETPLLLAVVRDLQDQANILINLGADIHAEDTGGTTPFVETVRHHRSLLHTIVTNKTSPRQDSKGRNVLHLAVLLKADNSLTEYLIQQKAPVNTGDKAGNTPLHYAVAHNRKSIGEALLANGANIFITNKQGNSPLKIAFTQKEGREVWILTVTTVSSADSNGDTPLHYAALWGMNGIIPQIIAKGGNSNAKNTKGETPLFTAVRANNPQTVQALFTTKAAPPLDGSARDIFGNTVLHAAIGWNAQEGAAAVLNAQKAEAAALLNAKNTAGKTALHLAAQKGDAAFISLFISHHADINIDDATGRTPLVEALRYGKTSAVLLLLKEGASPLRQDIQGRTALHEAVGAAPVSVITALRDAGADPLVRDSYGATPLSRALRLGKPILDAVLGNDVSLSNSDGETPLHIAVQEKTDEETLRYLISKRYAVDKRDKTGSTALLLAAQQNTLPLCSVLLASGADPFHANNEGESAVRLALTRNAELLPLIQESAAEKNDAAGNGLLHYAARYASQETIQKLLTGTQTDPGKKNLAGETPADIAFRWERPEIAALLQVQK